MSSTAGAAGGSPTDGGMPLEVPSWLSEMSNNLLNALCDRVDASLVDIHTKLHVEQ